MRKRHQIQHMENRCKFYQADIDNISSYKYDLITSNPPYILKSKIKNLEEDVKCFEPRLALNGGYDGISVIKLLINKSSVLLKKMEKLLLK